MRGLLFCFTLVACALFASSAYAVIQVPNDQPTIGDAVAAAAIGEEIQVVNTHVEPSTSPTLVISQDLQIISYEPTFNTPTAGATTNDISIGGATVTLQGLTITPDSGSGVLFSGVSNVTVDNCSISSLNGPGIDIPNTSSDSTLTVVNSNIDNNGATGISIAADSTSVTLSVSNSSVSGNNGEGIAFNGGGSTTNSNHNVSIIATAFNNNAFVGLLLGQNVATPATVSGCTFDGNQGFTHLHMGWEAENSTFNITNCTFTGGGGGTRGINMEFTCGSTFNIDGCNITATPGSGMWGDGLTVGCPTPSVVNASNTTVDGSSLVGLDAPQGDWILDNVTVINNALWGMNFWTNITPRALQVSNSTFSGNGFDGISTDIIHDSTFTNCVFEGSNFGMILGFQRNGTTNATVDITNCTFRNNTFVGLEMRQNDTVTLNISDSLFEGNGALPLVTEEVTQSLDGDANLTTTVNITDTIIRNGAVEATRVSADTVSMTNVLFDEGISVDGGLAAFNDGILQLGAGGTHDLLHVTVADGSSSPTFAIEEANGTLNLQNSIVSLNTPGGTAVQMNGTAGSIAFNLYDADNVGVTVDADSVLAAPLFVTPPAGTPGTADYHLQAGSPARDQGNGALTLPATDLDGNSRVQGAAPDMGVFEFADASTITDWNMLDY